MSLCYMSTLAGHSSSSSSISSIKLVVGGKRLFLTAVASSGSQSVARHHSQQALIRWTTVARARHSSHNSRNSSRPSTSSSTPSSSTTTTTTTTISSTSKKRQRSSLSLSRQRHQQQQQQKNQQQASSTTTPSSISSSFRFSNAYNNYSYSSSFQTWRTLFWNRLEQSLRRPRHLPIPRWISPKYFAPVTYAELFGHASFILVAISYAVDDFILLRSIAVIGSTCMLCFTYYHPHGRPLWLPFRWNVLFILLNTYRIGKVYWHEYWAEQLSRELIDFRNRNFYIMSPMDFAKLVRLAHVEEYAHGDLIITQGSMNYQVRLVLNGECRVLRNGKLTYLLEEANFISESGLHAGILLSGKVESCCTIVAATPITTNTGEIMSIEQQQEQERTIEQERRRATASGGNNNRKIVTRVLVWDRTELAHLLQHDASLRRSLEAAVSWDIVRKLKHQRSLVNHPELIENTAAWTERRQDQTQHRYTAILHNILQHHERSKKKKKQHNNNNNNNNISNNSSSDDSNSTIDLYRKQLTKYRMIHHIDEAHHNMALKECGWTPAEFKTGIRRQRQVGIRRVRTQFLADDDDEDDRVVHKGDDHDDDDDDSDDAIHERNGWRWYLHDIYFRIFG